MTTKNKNEQIEYIIQNWNKKSVKEMTAKLKVSRSLISQWVTRLRRLGVDLPRKNASIDWDYLQKKYAKKTE